MQGECVVTVGLLVHKVDVNIQVGTFVVEAGSDVAFHLVEQIQIIHELVICVTPTALQTIGKRMKVLGRESSITLSTEFMPIILIQPRPLFTLHKKTKPQSPQSTFSSLG